MKKSIIVGIIIVILIVAGIIFFSNRDNKRNSERIEKDIVKSYMKNNEKEH